MRALAPAASVTVIVPTYGNWWLTERCLRALEDNGLPGQQVVVVDDLSPDETRARLARTSGIDIAFAAENRGFAASCNAGAALARAEILLFLNADTVVQPGSIGALVDALDDPSVGIAGAKLLYPEGGMQHAGVIVDRNRVVRHAHWFRPEDLGDADVARDYPSVTGAALAIRAAVFRAVGGFDTAYRNGYEDVDLCFRIWAAGKRVRYVPRAHPARRERKRRAVRQRPRQLRALLPPLGTRDRAAAAGRTSGHRDEAEHRRPIGRSGRHGR
jgi:GT2 family glycosyltransferase